MVQKTKVQQVLELGQSIWCDYLSRELLRGGGLDRMIEQGVRGVTTNPSIFEKAISGTSDYDDDIRRLTAEGLSAEEICTALTVEDVREAADRLRPVFESSEGSDGFVSLEVSPLLADDEQGTIDEAACLFSMLARENVMIKIPATPAGIEAIRRSIARGINVNATLIFSKGCYRRVLEAWLSGLEQRTEADLPISGIASVASLFVSRIDTAVDKLLEGSDAQELAGHIAVDNARAAYASFEETTSTKRWEVLAAKGAMFQRPLWASTGTKNPAYSPTLYVDSLIGPNTVNTIPPSTFEKFLSGGRTELSVASEREEGARRLSRLAASGIDLDAVTARLLEEGLEAFTSAYRALLAEIEKKREAFSRS